MDKPKLPKKESPKQEPKKFQFNKPTIPKKTPAPEGKKVPFPGEMVKPRMPKMVVKKPEEKANPLQKFKKDGGC